MRVLFLTGACPYPPNNGGVLRTYNLLSRLCRYHDITLITPVTTQSVSELENAFDNNLRQIIPITSGHPETKLGELMHISASMIASLPHIARMRCNVGLSKALSETLCRSHYDVLHCDSISAAPAVSSKLQVPKVFNAHNVEAMIWERYVSEERNPLMRQFLKSQLNKVRAFEASLSGRFNAFVTVSDEDRKQMIHRYGFGNVNVVKNGVDIGYYSNLSPARLDNIAFIGSLDWRPNQDAIVYLLKDILPIIRRQMPHVNMSIIGRKPPGWVSKLCKSSSVSLYANVPDVRPYLAEASVVVVPLRIGGGSRLKILEAMAADRSVVSTTIGAEGLNVVHDKHLLIADNPDDFAFSVISLLRNPEHAKSITSEARLLVEAEYDWDRISRSLEDIWSKAARQQERSSANKGI